jgi:hypothetical protein
MTRFPIRGNLVQLVSNLMATVPYDTNALIAQSKAMLAQTAAQGTQSFAGSSYDTGFQGARQLGNTSAPNTGGYNAVQTINPSTGALYNAPSGNPPPAVTPTINASGLGNSQSANYPAQNLNTTDPASAILSVDTTNPYTPSTEVSNAQSDLNTNVSAWKSLVDKIAGKKQEQLQAENSAGIPQIKTQLSDINTQMQNIQKETSARMMMSQDRLAPTMVISGEQQQQQRQASIRLLGLSAIAQTLQGNLSAAQDQVNRAIDMEFAPYEAQLQYQEKLIDMNSDKLSRAEQKQMELYKIGLSQQNQQIQDAKADKRTIYGWVAEAAQLGNAPSLIISRALEAQDPTEALALLSPYLQDTNAKEAALLDLQYKRAQIANIGESNSIARAKLAEDKRQFDLTTGKAGTSTTGSSTISSVTGKPLSETERVSLGYATRMQQAGTLIDQIGKDFTGVTSYVGNSPKMPNFLKSEDRQKFEQAQRNFVNAVLRRESGAVISEEEFANAKQQYFPQPGDTSGVVEQKQQNRMTAINNMLSAGGQPAMTTLEDLRAKYAY